MSRRLDRDLSRERLVAYLAFSFGALTLLLASIGLYGVLSYGVARRTQEIGVRMALGARRIEVMRSVLGQSATLDDCGNRDRSDREPPLPCATCRGCSSV